MRLSLRKKIVALSCLAALLPLAVGILITLSVTQKVLETIDSEVDRIVVTELMHTVKNLFTMCEAVNSSSTGELTPARQAEARKAFMGVKFGKSGYAWALGGKTKSGIYIISKDGLRDGENILDSKDASGRTFVRDVLNKALRAKPGEVMLDKVSWINPGDGTVRAKYNAYTYFEPWDWIIGAGLYEDDFGAVRQRINESLGEIPLALCLSGGIIVLLMAGLAVLLANRMSRPLAACRRLLECISLGDLRSASLEYVNYFPESEVKSSDAEKAELARSLYLMIEGVRNLVGQVRRSGFQVAGSMSSIEASARQIEAAGNELMTSSTEVSASSLEISASATTLSGSMSEAVLSLNETSQLAQAGRGELQNMRSMMQSLLRSTEGIRAKFAVLGSKAEKISGVSETIGKIAEQTNMLSLNATIEAEKAGEYGHGFAVVAREIRRLADLTAESTLDIERMLEEMRLAVTREMRELEGFSSEVGLAVAEVISVGEKLGGVIEQIGALGPHFEEIKAGMRGQAEAAGQISQAMRLLSQGATESGQTIEEFKAVTKRLGEAVRGLQEVVASFEMDEESPV